MIDIRRRALCTVCTALAAGMMLSTVGSAWAQDFPAKAIRVIVPYPPASGTDVLGRAISQRLSTEIGQPVVVENRGGANGAIGMEAVAKAAPDGYTVLFTPGAPVLTTGHMYKLNIDTLKDLEPVALVATGVFSLVAHPSAPYKDMNQMIAYAKANPGKVTYASAGSGSQAHLLFEMVKREAGIEAVHVPYKGGGPALVDVLGGQVPLFFESLPVVLPHVRAERLRLFAVTSPARSPFAPDAPALVESMKGIDLGLANPWYAVFTTPGTPAPVVARLNAMMHKVAQSPELVKSLPEGGFVPSPATTPAEFRAFHRAKYEAAGKLIRALGLEAN